MDAPSTNIKLKGRHRAASRSDEQPITSSHAHDGAPAICRICRGEGTVDEPLFYPCKCSGSIKFVHQDCLMEWLSHSQKKYCELCKTSFRFTKLYAPDMPKSLPIHVVAGHMTRYLVRNVLVWLRAALALSVWVCWLPYFMRSVWSFMFWISDHGLGTSSAISQGHDDQSPYSLAIGTGVCPASPLFAPTTTSAVAAETALNGLSGRDLSEFIVRLILGSLGISGILDRSADGSKNSSATTQSSSLAGKPLSSLLGDVAFLNNLTGNPTVNRTVIAVLEGQIITVLVIICFILVILVRDYVVQQQPEINMRAAFAGPEIRVPPPGQLNFRPEIMEELRGPDESDDETLDDGERIDELMGDIMLPQPQAAANPLRARSNNWEDDELDEDDNMPQPHLVQGPATKEERASVYDYLRIHRLAAGDPERILQIVEEEGLEERLAYWVGVTRKSLRERQEQEDAFAFLPGPVPNASQYRPESSSSAKASSSARAFTPTSSDGDFAIFRNVPPATTDKGKERESPSASFDEGPVPKVESNVSLPLRPRAVSDGPQRHDTANPLANNSWSFADLPTEYGVKSTSPRHPEGFYQPLQQNGTSAPSSQDHQGRAVGSPTGQPLKSAFGDVVAGPAYPVRPVEEQPSPSENQNQQETNTPADGDANIVIPEAVAPVGLVGRVTDFMWGDLDHQHPPNREGEEAAAQDDVQDDNWEDVDDVDDNNLGDGPDGDQAGDVGIDPEAIEDMEDFEGVMELVGMRGPIAGLFQNAVFCAVLVSVTIFACIFAPYNIGRVSVWVIAHPIRLVRLLFELTKLLQDATVFAAGFLSWVALNLIDMITGTIGGGFAVQIISSRKASWALWTKAGSQVLGFFTLDIPVTRSEIDCFAAVSHVALLTVKSRIATVLSTISGTVGLIFGSQKLPSSWTLEAVEVLCQSTWERLVGIPSLLANPGSWVIDLGETEKLPPITPELAHWTGVDRFWAILIGYITLFFFGAMYLKRGSPFSRGHFMQAWEAGIIDTLHQASGIMKVIMIISIEMLVFPLYCGLLLDAALLPLFADTTFKSRMLFTYNYPLTSLFVHWFVGTGYMFHFALFVSMCRKIMRPGVLYFIRDPDDPEFHPVRDVLERNLTTQLRKILFSAMVYGALVIVCLGGVVWGLSFTLPNVLPIHYSSNESVLEFPVDLLFYNFLMPLAVSFFKPSDGLHVMYTWCFRKCARALRLTSFLFGERRLDEEGTIALEAKSLARQLPWYRTFFLELDDNAVIPKTWRDTFEGGRAKPSVPLTPREMTTLRHRKDHLKRSGQLEPSGRFVRAPASDRVKIPKGKKVFLEVSESGRRKDGLSDNDLYTPSQYQVVYIPPHFQKRVFLFIFCIWMFAAITGVGLTIIPLTVGRTIFKQLIPAHINTNDIYAFSIGIYLLGSLTYSIIHIHSLVQKVRAWFEAAQGSVMAGRAVPRVISVVARGAKLAYAYFVLLVMFPLLVSALVELYMLIPLHTYMYPPTAVSVEAARHGGVDASHHTVRVMQAWVLGLLYVKLGARMVTSVFYDTRLATATRTVLRRGWLHPDVGVLTRAFVVPGLTLATLAILAPSTITAFLFRYGIFNGPQAGANEAAEAARVAIVYRQSYPVVATFALLIRHAVRLVKVFNAWTGRVREDAYLIGERLHNFGAVAAGARRVKGAWRAGGDRL